MGPVRHRHLINWLSMAVALQLSVALVALSARAGRDIGPRAKAEFSIGGAQNVGILAGTEIAKRRDPAPSESPTSTPAPAAVTPAGDNPMATAAATRPAAAGDKGQPGALVDQPGDTVADGSGKPTRDARADIVRAGAVYRPDGVTFALQVQRPADPRTDERWASDSTYARWEVDTDGDSVPDFEVQYHIVDEESLGGSVSKPGDGGEPVCAIHAGTYSAEGYKITVDPACLGNPAAISYRATVYYDTDPSDENADVVTDTAPNAGWSSSIPRPS